MHVAAELHAQSQNLGQVIECLSQTDRENVLVSKELAKKISGLLTRAGNIFSNLHHHAATHESMSKAAEYGLLEEQCDEFAAMLDQLV